MSAPRDFDGIVREWLESGPTLLSERAFDTAMVQVHRTRQRRTVRLQRRFSAMHMSTRLAAVAVIGVLAVGAALFLARPGQPAVVGGPSPTPGASASPSEPASPSAVPSPSVVPARAASWTATGSMARALGGQSAALLPDGRVLVAGDEYIDNGPPRATADLYDPTTGSWTTTGRGYSGGRLTLLLDGRVLAGASGLYDPGTGAWTATGRTVKVHQGGETITLLLDGRVLLAGGHDDRYPPKGVTGSAELYNPRTGRWTVTGSMITPRAGHTATLLPDGKVLVAGGGDWQDATASAELYDPASGTWTATGTMLMPYSNQVATLLADGRVLVAGFALASSSRTPPPFCPSGPCKFVSVVELYDPASGRWTATGTMAVARAGFTDTLLPDGKVLVAGGVDLVSGTDHDPALASVELYDPGTGSWTATATMAVARNGHTATLLPDGRVLVAGGGSLVLASFLASAELYDPGSP
jgi:Galactose oxidase, central domain/Kelch motif